MGMTTLKYMAHTIKRIISLSISPAPESQLSVWDPIVVGVVNVAAAAED